MIPLEPGRSMPHPEMSDTSWGPDSGVFFAATVMVIIGVVQTFQGIAALVNPDFFQADSTYAFATDATTWGWAHLALGVLLLVAGVYLFKGSRVAGIIAIVLASLSAIANFLFVPHYPFWGIIIFAVDVWIVWSIAASGVLSSSR